LKRYIKKFLKKIIINVLKEMELPLSFSNNPYNINFSEKSKIEKPLSIINGERIYLGENSFIGKSGWLGVYATDSIAKDSFIKIEKDVYIGNFCCITAIDRVEIGEGTLISEHFYASDHTHGFDPSIDVIPAKQKLESKGIITIGNRCFIGFRVSILPGVTLGNHCVVGAHSTVTHNFPDYSMIAGSPAKLIKTYSFDEKKWINAESI